MSDLLRPAGVRLRPTAAGAGLLGASVVCLLVAWTGFGAFVGTIAVVGLALLAVATLSTWRRAAGLRVFAPPPLVAFAGERFPVTIAVANTAVYGAAADVLVLWSAERLRRGQVVGMIERVVAAHTVEVAATFPALPRGRRPQGVLELDTTFPLGLVSCRTAFVLPHDVVVFPRLGSIRRTVRRSGTQHVSVLHGFRTRGDEQEVRGLHRWRAGESPRTIHWKLSARRGRRIAREFGGEPRPPVRVVLVTALDLRRPNARPHFEDAVSVAATLVEHHLRHGHAVRVTLAGAEATTLDVRPGVAGLLPVLHALAALEPTAAQPHVEPPSAPADRHELVFVVGVGVPRPPRGSPVRVLDAADASSLRIFDRARRPGRSLLARLLA